MSRWPRLAASLAALVLLPAARAGEEAAALKFAWAVPSKVTVTEKILKRGNTATTRYTASLERAGPGDDLRLHLADLEFLELQGKPASDPAVAQQIALALPMSRVTPDVLLGADGSVKSVAGIELAIDTMLREIEKNGDERQKAALPVLRAQLLAPESQAAMKNEAAKHWQAWVGEWTGRVIPEGRGVESAHRVRCPDGTEIEAPTRLRRMPGASEGAGLVKLTRESVLDGEDARPSLDAWVRKMGETTGRRPPDGFFTGMRLVDRALAVTDPATLRPVRVLREEQRILHVKDQDDRVDVERHEYTFAWPAPEPPRPPDSGK